MARNMSFALTTEQIRNRTKTVTRRTGWNLLKVGDVVNACVKCMGFKKGEKIERLCQIRITDIRDERLDVMIHDPAYGDHEATLEGFPDRTGAEFVEHVCKCIGVKPKSKMKRIEFEYIDEGATV